MASSLEHFLPPTNFNRCRIRTSYRHRLPSQQDNDISSPTSIKNVTDELNVIQPLRPSRKEMEILLQQHNGNMPTQNLNFKVNRHKSIIKHNLGKPKKHVTINLPHCDDQLKMKGASNIYAQTNVQPIQGESPVDTININDSKNLTYLNDDINIQYMEFAKLIKLKEDNVLLKEEILALRASLTQKELEIDKYKEVVKKLLRKNKTSNPYNQELNVGKPHDDDSEIMTDQSRTAFKGINLIQKCSIIVNENSARKEFISKMSEKVRLKRIYLHKRNEPNISGTDLIKGVKNPTIIKHLMQPLVAKAEWDEAYKTSYCFMSQIKNKADKLPELSTCLLNDGASLTSLRVLSESKFVEGDQLKSRCDRLSVQAEVLRQNLSESKQNADDLALKLTESEGALISFQRMYHVTHQTNIILEVLLALKESQISYLTAMAAESNKESAYNSCETCSDELGFYQGDEPFKVSHNGPTNRHTDNSLPLLSTIHHKLKSEQMAVALLNLVEYRYGRVLNGQNPDPNPQSRNEPLIKSSEPGTNNTLSPHSYAFNSLSSRGSSSTGNSSAHEYSSLENQVTQKMLKSFTRDNEKRLKTFLRLIKIRENHLKKQLAQPFNYDNVEVFEMNNEQCVTFNACYKQFFRDRYGNVDGKNNGDNLGIESAEGLILKSLDIQKFIDNLIIPMPDTLMPQSSYHIYEDPTKCRAEMSIENPGDFQQLALENSIILLELFETKEEMARLKAQKYYMDKEKNLVEVRLSIKDNLEASLKSQIDSLEQDLADAQKNLGVVKGNQLKMLTNSDCEESEDGTLQQSLMREYRLRKQIEELMGVVENISANSERRYQNAMDVIMELRHTNSFLHEKCDKIRLGFEAKFKGLQECGEQGNTLSENEPFQSDDMNNETDL